MRLVAIAALIAGLGCTRTTELIDDGSIPGLIAIEVTTDNPAVVVADLTAVERVNFTAIGTFASGDTRDITAEVSWGVDNAIPGAFTEPGIWESSNRAGGRVRAEARAGQIVGDTTFAVHFEPVLVDPSFPPPPGAADLFEAPVPIESDPARAPQIAYPAAETMFPINLYRTLFQLEDPGPSDVYRFRFESELLDLRVLTTNDRWQAEAATWDYLALTAAGDTVVMTVEGVESSRPAEIRRGAPIDLHFSEASVEGAIYYWSTSSEGIVKGVLSAPAPTRFYTQGPDTTCVACHTISRDGTRMAVGYDGEVLQQVSVPSRDTEIPASEDYAMGWATFSPDSSRLLLANKGALRLIDADTGAPIGADGSVDLGNLEVTHPDWSPLGDHVAVAVCERAGNNKDVEGCAIGRIPVSGDSFGDVEILVPAAGGEDNNYFPRYSPDGAWIAYVNAEGKSKDQDTASLRLVASSGGDPIDLVLASSRVGPLDGVVDTGSTMPTWAPTTHPGVQWLAFSSVRDYGKVLVGDKADQLWVAAIDTARTGDPSFAAFWLPLQDIGERNHRAFWAVDTAVECVSQLEVCDGFDNDCDGVVDDECEPCGDVEICVDGADNDCNGAVDDGCIQ